ncbi:TrbG/VirB9 family P-type conjugative transfer protein [Caulobacter sp. NIBR2454]|uniref:TrbG/VirB9 family P-type conjugative transfer protein n=1 Tax=Caulobacter sp. NIBR2454 TaxID=3015996 RepID=UPI0022B6CC80|nr:TrbG/VirB9 family P-type conjugative transfer protein [Caulobacter sp. NIBR2454]
MRRLVPLLLAASLCAGSAVAAVQPVPGAADARIRSVFYDPAQVVEVVGHLGYQLMIEFAPGERIENVSIGDSLAWQVTPNRKADLLFIKPLETDAATNMAVVTDRRRYNFQLTARQASGPRDPRLIYGVRFDYPPEPEVQAADAQPAAPVVPAPEARNGAYTYTGDARLAPQAVFDDGRSTWLSFPPDVETPGVFAVDAAGVESVVNFSVRAGYVVVDQLSPAFILRRGKQSLTLHNDAWREPVPGPDSPQPRPKERLRLFGGKASTDAQSRSANP